MAIPRPARMFFHFTSIAKLPTLVETQCHSNLRKY